MFSNFRQLHQVMKDHSKSTRMRAVAAAVGEEVGFDEFDLKGGLIGVGMGEVVLVEGGMGEVGIGRVCMGQDGISKVGSGPIGMSAVGRVCTGQVGMSAVGGPVGMNEVGMGVVGMGALGETSKSQTSRINQASNKIKCGPCRLLIGQVYLNSQSFSLNLCTRGRSGPSRSLIGQVYLTSKIFSLKLCIRGRSGPSRSLIGQVYLISQSFSLKLCIRGRSGPSRSLIGQVYLTSQSFSLKLCTRGRVVLTLTSDQLTRFIVSRFIMLLITCIEKASTEIKSGQRLKTSHTSPFPALKTSHTSPFPALKTSRTSMFQALKTSRTSMFPALKMSHTSLFYIGINDVSRMKNTEYSCTALHDPLPYDMSFLKLAQLLLAGDVESNPGPVDHIQTPKGKGRPKKTKRKLNFGKPKTLNFSPIIENNRFLEHLSIIHMNDIKPWSVMCPSSLTESQFIPLPDLNSKISLIQANIVNIKVDAIVNAAKNTLLGGQGIDGVIHKAAGSELRKKCEQIYCKKGSDIRCETGECKVTDTKGCNLLCNYVFHTVGPKVEDENEEIMEYYSSQLFSCYDDCLEQVLTYNVKSIVFPCISTGLFKFPNRKAAQIALYSVRKWMENNYSQIDQVVFCTYEDHDFDIYQELMCEYFPVSSQIVQTENRKLENELSSIEQNNSTVIENNSPGYEASNIMRNIPVAPLNYSESNEAITLTENVPVPLKNRENVCFFNSVVQVFYSLIHFRAQVYGEITDNHVIRNLRQLS